MRAAAGPRATRKGILLDILLTARWMAIVALLLDAAIPSRLPRGPEVTESGHFDAAGVYIG